MAIRVRIPKGQAKKCTPSRDLNVSIQAFPKTIEPNTVVHLAGLCLLTEVTANCEVDSRDGAFTWSLSFQPTGGLETDVTSSLVRADTLQPAFLAASRGDYRARLEGSSTPPGQIITKTAEVLIHVAPLPPQQVTAPGHLTLLQVFDLGHGGRFDQQAVFELGSEPNKSFGFELRDDANLPARQAMLDLLRAAFTDNWTVRLEYVLFAQSSRGIILGVTVEK